MKISININESKELSYEEMISNDGVYECPTFKNEFIIISGKLRIFVKNSKFEPLNDSCWTHRTFVKSNTKLTINFSNE